MFVIRGYVRKVIELIYTIQSVFEKKLLDSVSTSA